MYPDAFEKFLGFEDEQLQDMAYQAAEIEKVKEESDEEYIWNIKVGGRTKKGTF